MNLIELTEKLIGKAEEFHTSSKLFSLILRLANNYKIADQPEI